MLATSGRQARSNGFQPENYQTRSIPLITSREPLWEQENLAEDVEAGRYYLPGTATGGRETVITSPIDARPQYILQMPGPSWKSFFAAIFTAFFFLGLTVKLYVPAFICGGLAVALSFCGSGIRITGKPARLPISAVASLCRSMQPARSITPGGEWWCSSLWPARSLPVSYLHICISG